ncbi:unnamed protein product [Victoria cruziana]
MLKKSVLLRIGLRSKPAAPWPISSRELRTPLECSIDRASDKEKRNRDSSVCELILRRITRRIDIRPADQLAVQRVTARSIH